MTEKHFTDAVSLAKAVFDAREQFARALRDAAIAQIEAGPSRNVYSLPAGVSQHTLELYVDDALRAICRGGPGGLENHVRTAIDEIVRETLDETRKGTSR